nr:hypothetical protein [Listeria floridensis]
MIKLTMLSSAEKVKGQGVASAYRELVNLVEEHLSDQFDLAINSFRKSDITHYHTVDFHFYLSTFFQKRSAGLRSAMFTFCRKHWREVSNCRK